MTNNSIVVPPDPKRMIEGLRDTGYDFNTAIADLIDNSVAAHANIIDIRIDMEFDGSILVSIADNGIGMDYEQLLNAMKYGAPPRSDPKSLGKFGLGLKTASTAFCRCLSVSSRPGPDVTMNRATWDLDHVAEVAEWELLISDPEQIDVDHLSMVAEGHAGTVVRWTNVDRLLKEYADAAGKHARNALNKKIEDLKLHLSTTYQRFLDSEDSRELLKVQMWVNGEQVPVWDPFCEGESELVASATIPVGHEDTDDVMGEFTVRAFVLPRGEEFSNNEAAKRARISNETQGIYIYRENRLIHEADWLGMYSKEPHGSLLRVELSFGAELDEALQVDIKKSRIVLNETLYSWLKEEFLPAPRRAADERYRKGLLKTSKKAAAGAHDKSNNAIRNKEKDIPKAGVNVVDAKKNEVEVTNSYGTTRLVIKFAAANKPGEVFVQPVDSIQDGLLWQPVLIDGHQAIQINSSHDFYRKVYLPNIVSSDSNTSTVQGMDSLLWAIGIAELKAYTDATKTHFSDMRYEISKILRQLVEHLPEPPEPGETNGNNPA